MLLEPTLVLTLASACAPNVAPATLLAVARAESGLDPLAIGVGGRQMRLRNAAEAVATAQRLAHAGRDFDVGLGQLNVRNLPRLGLTLADAFDPCRNLAGAAEVLAEAYRRGVARAGPGLSGLKIALSYYNTGRPLAGFGNGYVARVTRAALTPRATASAPPSAEPGPAPAWDVFGDARPDAGFVQSPTGGETP